MSRIFFTLAVIGGALLISALLLGFEVGNPQEATAGVRRLLSYHLLTSVAALIFAALVHAVLLTYFMGTGRWIEETSAAYKLDGRWMAENNRLKYRAIPIMAACLVLLILNIPFGALSVDGAAWTVPGVGAVSPSHVHLWLAVVTILVNLAVNGVEYRVIKRNGELIAEVVAEVRRIREAHGLPT